MQQEELLDVPLFDVKISELLTHVVADERSLLFVRGSKQFDSRYEGYRKQFLLLEQKYAEAAVTTKTG